MKDLAPDVRCIWIGSSPAIDLIKSFYPEVDCIGVHNDAPLSAIELDRLRSVNCIVDLQCNPKSYLFTRKLRQLSNSPLIRSNKLRTLRNLLVLKARLRSRQKELPKSVRHPQILQYELMEQTVIRALIAIGQLKENPSNASLISKPKLPLAALGDTQRIWEKELKYGCWIAIAPGASFPTKKAPLSLIVRIVERLKVELQTHSPKQNFGLLFIGNADDRETSVHILEKLNWPGPIMNLAGQTSIVESAIAVSRCKALLGNDAGLSHIAEAVNVPVTMLFGPTAEGFGFAPHLPGSQAFSASLGCRPCSKHGRTKCRFGDKLCFELLSIDAIAQHIAKNARVGLS